MRVSIVGSLCVLLFFPSFKCNTANIHIEPESVIINSTSTTKFLCTTVKNDSREFEVSLSPNTSAEYIQISIHHLNETAIEIIMQSFDYIGVIYLICSLSGQPDSGTRADIVIGKAPGSLMREKRCVVYYDEYIDCTIIAPVMVQVVLSKLPYELEFTERTVHAQSRVYRPNPKLVTINSINKTLTFRWFPEYADNFPLRLRMDVSATLPHFGTTNYTLDMTPIYRISSNFTVQVISPTDLQIEFNHRNFSALPLCHGNLTREENMQSSEREDIRTFDESNQTNIRVTGLHSNTWYHLCFYCRHDRLTNTISDTECHRYKTSKPPMWFSRNIIILIVGCLVFLVIIIVIWNRNSISQQRSRLRYHATIADDNENNPAPLTLAEFIPQNYTVKYYRRGE